MTAPRKFKAPYNPKERIWQQADQLRAAYSSGRCLPVKVLDLAEFDLGVELVPADSSDEVAVDYIATRIAPKFGVSAEVIAKRLRVEKLWSPTLY